ncbi:YdcF family protein [Spirosoma areae]
MVALGLAFFVKNHQYRRRLTGVSLGIFWLFGNSFLMNELALWWEYPIQADSAVPADSTQRVAIILTGGMINSQKAIPGQTRRTTNRFLLSREADRAGQALYLYKTGAVQKILISGGNGYYLPFQAEVVNDEGKMAAQFLLVAGVRASDIMFETKSRNTHENAIFSAQILRQRFRTNQYVLITSGCHMRRAVACFQKQGVTVLPFPGYFMSHRRLYAPGDWLLPHEEPFLDAYFLVRELVGYLTYKVMGYI